jgi:hypothetical protein
MYSSTSALLSKWCALVSAPSLIFCTLGSDDQMKRETPAASDASAMALPWAISICVLSFSQSFVDQSFFFFWLICGKK